MASICAAITMTLAAAAAVVLLSSCASCDSTVRQTAMPVLASGTFDGMEIDQRTNLAYIADRADKGVDVVDVGGSTPRFVETVPVGGLPNGLAVASDRQRLFAGLQDGTVAVIDTAAPANVPMRVIARIQADSNGADLLEYSATNGRLYVGSGGVGHIVVIDADENKVLDSIPVNVDVEQPRLDPADGMLYVTSAGSDPLLRVDPKQRVVTRTFTLAGCHASGLAINPSRQLAMVACGGSVALFNLNSGTNTVSRAVAGGDLVTYDPRTDRFVVASPHGPHDSTLAVFYGDGTFLGSIAVPPVAHAAVIAANDGRVYAPGLTGLTSFAPAVCAPLPDWMNFALGLSAFAAPLAAFALFLVLYARRQARMEEMGEKPVPAWRRKQAYLEEERQRMRELEDAIFDTPSERQA